MLPGSRTSRRAASLRPVSAVAAVCSAQTGSAAYRTLVGSGKPVILPVDLIRKDIFHFGICLLQRLLDPVERSGRSECTGPQVLLVSPRGVYIFVLAFSRALGIQPIVPTARSTMSFSTCCRSSSVKSTGLLLRSSITSTTFTAPPPSV